ncbi:CSPP1 protein, partial [Ramphastos sulfuratus]|nr:CSPP1 protein [Ramphastos sulfuratus]
MADELEQFIEEQKAKLAQDKAELEEDPPYMELRTKESEKLSETSKMLISMAKENIPPNSQHSYLLGDYGLSLPLQEEYEWKKHKLKEELRQDYKRYLSQEKLRLERNKEYNQYLRDKEEWNKRLRSLGRKSTEMYRNRNLTAVSRLQLAQAPKAEPSHAGAEPPKKDAVTSTESCEELQTKRWLEEERYHRLGDEAGLRGHLLSRRVEDYLDVPSGRCPGFASQSGIPIRKHHRLDEGYDFGRRFYRMDYGPELGEEVGPRLRCGSAYNRRSPHVSHADRYLLSDRTLLQRKKEKYRQELREQIAEQQRNRRREKELELLVAASGAQDPEKEPSRLKQFGLSATAPEDKVPPEKPQVAFQTPVPASSTSPVREDFPRGLGSTLGEAAASRCFPMPAPPPTPVLAASCRTAYNDASGAHDPLEHSLAHHGTGVMGVQPTADLDPPVGQAAAEQPVIGQRSTGDRQRSRGALPEGKPKPAKEATVFYQQELRQQIQEREERRRQERKEKEHLEAKLEAELRNNSPWGRGGGGAPLKDAQGNLIADLNMMHRRNEELYRNPEARLYQDKRPSVADPSLASPRPENTKAPTNEPAGFLSAKTSPFARGNIFGKSPSAQQLQQQESYRNFLQQQIEENRQRKEAERERLRLEEEKEEKRLAEERLRIQKAYEEEQEERRRKNEMEQLRIKEIIQWDEEKQKEARKRQLEKEKQEKEKQDEQLRQQLEKEKVAEEKMPRQPSPVIPALQSKALREERIPSAESHLSHHTEDPPHPRVPSPPIPAIRNQLCAFEGRPNVLSELSETWKQPRSEERQLHVAAEEEVPTTRRREKKPKDIFECARVRRQAAVRRPSAKEAQDPVNVQNIWDFNELKYKGRWNSETRMGLRQMYPDPPRDDQTLEIQQQALLREQQKRLTRMRRE